MRNILFEISDNLLESIAKTKAVADLIRIADHENLAKDTLPDIGWLLNDELKRMEAQIDRLPLKQPGNPV